MDYNKPVMVDDLQLVTHVPRISLHTNLRCIKRRRKGTGWGVGVKDKSSHSLYLVWCWWCGVDWLTE